MMMDDYPPRRVGLYLRLSTAFARRVLEGVTEYAGDRWEVLAQDWDDLSSGDRATLDGVIVEEGLERFEPTCPWVTVSQGRSSQAEAPAVGLDWSAVGEVAAEHFLERRLRSLAFLAVDKDTDWPLAEAAFMERACAGCVGHVAVRWLDDLQVALALRSLPRPAGLFVNDDLAARRALRLCRAAYLRVPEDVAVLAPGLRDFASRMASPPLSTLEMPARQMGRAAALLLESQWSGGGVPAGPVLVAPAEVVLRQSTDVLPIDDATVAAAVRFIETRLHAGVTVSSVAEHVATSRRWLEVKFLQHLGRGPATEIRQARLRRAKRLLVETDWTVKRISRECGFNSPERLCVIFRRELGMSPNGYRASHGQAAPSSSPPGPRRARAQSLSGRG